jgi:hypothetical protein
LIAAFEETKAPATTHRRGLNSEVAISPRPTLSHPYLLRQARAVPLYSRKQTSRLSTGLHDRRFSRRAVIRRGDIGNLLSTGSITCAGMVISKRYLARSDLCAN